jgi:hypothetical protein
LCPTHFSSAKLKAAAERREEHGKKLIKEVDVGSVGIACY